MSNFIEVTILLGEGFIEHRLINTQYIINIAPRSNGTAYVATTRETIPVEQSYGFLVTQLRLGGES